MYMMRTTTTTFRYLLSLQVLGTFTCCYKYLGVGVFVVFVDGWKLEPTDDFRTTSSSDEDGHHQQQQLQLQAYYHYHSIRQQQQATTEERYRPLFGIIHDNDERFLSHSQLHHRLPFISTTANGDDNDTENNTRRYMKDKLPNPITYRPGSFERNTILQE